MSRRYTRQLSLLTTRCVPSPCIPAVCLTSRLFFVSIARRGTTNIARAENHTKRRRCALARHHEPYRGAQLPSRLRLRHCLLCDAAPAQNTGQMDLCHQQITSSISAQFLGLPLHCGSAKIEMLVTTSHLAICVIPAMLLLEPQQATRHAHWCARPCTELWSDHRV